MKREIWVDWAKTLSMIAIVVGHSDIQLFHPFVYAFHVPSFFVISGYLYKPQKWYKTLLSFLIPVAVFSIFTFVYRLLASDFDFIKVWRGSTWFVYKLDGSRPLFTGLWFLEVLYVGRLLLGDVGIYFLRRFYKRASIFAFVFSCLIDFFDVEMSLYVCRIIQCLPFMGLGIYLKECHLLRQILKVFDVPWVCLLCCLVFLTLVYVNSDCDIMYNRYNKSYLLFFANAVLGILLLIYFCINLPQLGIIEDLSIGTLAILGTHIVVIDLCHHYLGNGLLADAMSLCISFVFAYFVIKFAINYCPFMLGKLSINRK